MPDGLVAFGVDVVRVQRDVGELPLQALGLDLLKGGFADEVSRLGERKTPLLKMYSWLNRK